MQFLLIICHDAAFEPTPALVREIGAWVKEMQSRGILQHGNPLRPPDDAMTVRVRGGKRTVTAGPFTDSPEKMAAYSLIACAGMQEAIDIAAGHPMAKAATIEVRPVWSDLPRMAA
jgi:hypothetical protein